MPPLRVSLSQDRKSSHLTIRHSYLARTQKIGSRPPPLIPLYTHTEAQEELVTFLQSSYSESLNHCHAQLTRLEVVIQDRCCCCLLINNHNLPIPPFNRQHAAELFEIYDQGNCIALEDANKALALEELAHRSWDSVHQAKDQQS